MENRSRPAAFNFAANYCGRLVDELVLIRSHWHPPPPCGRMRAAANTPELNKSMEINPLLNQLKDLEERSGVLRGYL